MAVIVITIFVVIFTFVYFFIKQKLTYWKHRGVPHVTPEFLFGNTRKSGITEHVIETLDSIYKKMKGKSPIAGVYMYTQPVCLILDPNLLKNILVKDFHLFHNRGSFYDELNDPLSAHLFNLCDDKWRKLRYKLSPTFTFGKIKAMFNLCVKTSNTLDQVLSERLKYHNMDDDNEIEMKDLLGRFTTDNIGNCAFGLEINSLCDEDNIFRKMGLKAFEANIWRNLYEAFLGMYQDVAKALKLKQTPGDVETFFMNIVKETIEYREKNNVKRDDFMDLLISLKNHGRIDDEKVGYLSINEIAAQSYLFFLAGFETTSMVLSFLFYELAKNPSIQEKLRNEVQSVLNSNQDCLTYETASNISYLNQVIHETQRKWPSVTYTVRQTQSEYKIPDSELSIPGNIFIAIPFYSLHRDEEYFPDPETFDPDRFSEENKSLITPFTYMPFGDGPRNCLGVRFALMQIRIAVITLIKSYKFSLTERSKKDMKIVPQILPFLNIKGGMWLKVEKLHNTSPLVDNTK